MQKPLELSLISNEAFQEIFRSMTEGIVVINESGKILVVNRIAEEMFGYERGELVGKNLELLLPVRYREGHVKHMIHFNKNPSPRRMGLGRDLLALSKSGKEFPVEISLSSSVTNGRFIAIAFVSDISWRKKAEDALRQSEEQLIVYASELEKKVQSRTEDLNVTIEKLEREVTDRKKAEEEAHKALEKERELNELKSKFVSIASHEFRTPLSTVLSSVSLIEQYKAKGDLDKIDKHVQRVKSSVNHLTSILNDLLSLGKLEEGKVEVVLETINPHELLNDIHEQMKASFKSGQTISIKCDVQKFFISDARILRNILFNLISNASKYSEEGKTIHLSCDFTNGMLNISVRDEGIGIPEDDQRHLFDRFFRATNVTNIQGTGLGLNIVKRYVELLDGKIFFESEYGKGSTFIISIPIEFV